MSKPGGSLGNPVGFGFGSPPKTADPSGDKPSSGFSFAKHPDAKGGLADGATSNGFSFAKPVESTSEANGEDTNGGTTEGGSEAPVLGGPNPHDVEGEGEEDEETTHEIKAKAFKLKTDKDGKTLWAEMGVGQCFLWLIN
jgi:nucleoporin NUP2